MLGILSFFSAVYDVISDSFKLRNKLLKEHRYNVSE